MIMLSSGFYSHKIILNHFDEMSRLEDIGDISQCCKKHCYLPSLVVYLQKIT